jgi:hypothetical protein
MGKLEDQKKHLETYIKTLKDLAEEEASYDSKRLDKLKNRQSLQGFKDELKASNRSRWYSDIDKLTEETIYDEKNKRALTGWQSHKKIAQDQHDGSPWAKRQREGFRKDRTQQIEHEEGKYKALLEKLAEKEKTKQKIMGAVTKFSKAAKFLGPAASVAEFLLGSSPMHSTEEEMKEIEKIKDEEIGRAEDLSGTEYSRKKKGFGR